MKKNMVDMIFRWRSECVEYQGLLQIRCLHISTSIADGSRSGRFFFFFLLLFRRDDDGGDGRSKNEVHLFSGGLYDKELMTGRRRT